MFWLPSKFFFYFRSVDCVAAVVSGPILHKGDCRRVLFKISRHAFRKREVVYLIICTDVVYLARYSLQEGAYESRTMVGNMNPIAHVAPIPVYRYRFTFH